MAVLTWDNEGEKLFETGVEKGVLFVADNDGGYEEGVAWNGLTSVTESPSGAEPEALYADNQKYLNLLSAEEFAATIEAYMYPDAFAECDGSASIATGVSIGQQKRKSFAFSYETKVGNDTLSTEYGRKIHIIYGCYATPSEKQYNTINDSPEAITMSWEISTTPVKLAGYKPTAHVVVDTKKVNNDDMITALEKMLYGDTSSEPTLPTLAQLVTMFTPTSGENS